MSVVKLLSRIVAPSDVTNENDNKKKTAPGPCLSPPLNITRTVSRRTRSRSLPASSALIHDVDHIGVPNTQLIKENTTIAFPTKAECRRAELSRSLLGSLDERYKNLRRTITTTMESSGSGSPL
jgi:hypothetical protein